MINPAESKAAGNLFNWSMRDDWWTERETTMEDHLAAAADDFGIRWQDLPEVLGAEFFAMVMQWIVEDFFTRRFGEDGWNVVDDYLKRRGWRESGSGKRYLRSIRDSIPSLYEVVDLNPGHFLVLRDLLRGGDPVKVEEKLGSETAALWDCLATRMVTVNGQAVISGGLLHFEREAADALVQVFSEVEKKARQTRKRMAKKSGAEDSPAEARVTDLLLREASFLLTRAWVTHALEKLAEPLPLFRNSDGEDIVLTRLGFPIVGDIPEIERKLDAAAFLQAGSENARYWDWLDRSQGKSTRDTPSIDARELVMMSQAPGGEPVLGGIELEGSQLVLHVNSRERAERGRTLLASLLGGLVGAPVTSVQSVEEALADAGDRGDRTEPGAVPPEIAAPLIKEYMDEHYRNCLDSPLPVLDGKSPRQAVRSIKGRVRVVDWLKGAENRESRQARRNGTEPYDFTWLWKELGILDRRA